MLPEWSLQKVLTLNEGDLMSFPLVYLYEH